MGRKLWLAAEWVFAQLKDKRREWEVAVSIDQDGDPCLGSILGRARCVVNKDMTVDEIYSTVRLAWNRFQRIAC